MASFYDPMGGGSGLGDAAPLSSKAEVLYTAQESLVRLDRIRRVLVQHSLDAILFIAGVDSQDNLGCLQALNYVLLGACGSELLTPLLLDDDYDDTILVVTRGGARIYTTPLAGPKLTRITQTWPQVEVVSLDRISYKNQDLFESHKMEGFRRCMEGLRRVGVAISPHTPSPDAGRHMAVERWPLVQSYALDSEGQRQFFTMVHEVVDVYPDMEQVYRQVGAHEIAAAVSAQAPLLSQHWGGVLQLFATSAKRGVHPAAFTPENLETYFTYGSIRRGPTLAAHGICNARWRVGAQAGDPTPPPGTPSERFPLHGTLEAYDPQAPLCAARTVFLQGEHCGVEGFGPASDATRGVIPAEPPTAESRACLQRLAMLYAVLGRTCERLKGVYASDPGFGSNGESDINCAQDIFGKTASDCGVSSLPGAGVADGCAGLSVTFRQMDNAPYTTSSAGSSSPSASAASATSTSRGTVLYMRLHLKQVLSPAGEVLGGLLYGDTVARAAGLTLTLTQQIPQISLGRFNGVGLQGEQSMRKVLGRVSGSPDSGGGVLSQLLVVAEPITGGHAYLPVGGFAGGVPISGPVHCFTGGIVFSDAAFGSLPPLVFSDHAERIDIYNPPELAKPTVIFITHKETWSPWTPLRAAQQAGFAMEGASASPQRCIAVVFKPGTPAKKDCLMKVLPVWKKALGSGEEEEGTTAPAPVLHYIEALPEALTKHARFSDYVTPREQRKSHHGLQVFETVKDYRPFKKVDDGGAALTKVEAVSQGHTAAMGSLAKEFPGFRAFYTARSLAESGDPGQGGVLLPRGMDPAVEGAAEIKVDIVAGWLGVGKHKFVAHVANVLSTMQAGQRKAGEEVEHCHVLAQDLEEGLAFDPMIFYRQVREVAELGGRRRILYTPPGCTPLPFVVHHLAQMTRKIPALGLNSVTAVLHGDSVYANSLSAPHNFQLLPGLACQLTAGFVGQVLLTAGQSSGGLNVNQLETFARTVNSVCDVKYSQSDAVEGLLQPKDLRAEAMENARRLSHAHLYHHPSACGLQMVQVKFSRLITTRYRVMEFSTKVSDHGDVAKGVLRMKAFFHCDGEHLQVTVSKGKPHQTRVKVLGQDPVLRHSQHMVFIGQGLNEVLLRDQVQHHLITKSSIVNSPGSSGEIVYDLKKRRAQITRDSLQDQDIEDINSAMHHKNLPSGWYSDGLSYVNPQQEKYQRLRPDIDVLIDDYITSYNAEVDRHNAEAARLNSTA